MISTIQRCYLLTVSVLLHPLILRWTSGVWMLPCLVPRKGFMLPTGLAIVGVSEKVQYQIQNVSRRPGDTYLGCGYFDFANMINANEGGYFPYTPLPLCFVV